jgi:hypothetical protein
LSTDLNHNNDKFQETKMIYTDKKKV